MSSSEGFQMSNQDYKDAKTNINTEFIDPDLESESIDIKKETFNYNQTGEEKGSKWRQFIDSFKRVEVPELDPNLTEQERIAIITAHTPLKHHLKSRHLQMIAIGGAIGTGLFVGSGTALRTAGPASLIIGWSITGSMIYSMVMAVAEMAVLYPISGGFTTYATRFIDESFGFANNFNYMLQWLVVLPLEIVSASITVNYWGTPTKYRDGFVALFWLVIVIINLFGVKGYGEAEFIFSTIKVITVVGFIILGLVLVCGGGPTGGYVGAKYWHDPGAFVGATAGAQFQGFCSVFVTAAFSFSGSELIGIAGSEAENPRKAVPPAAKQVFWRILLFYILSLLFIGLLVPSNDSRLIGSSNVDAAASPFVIAITVHGIRGLPSVINVVILIAVLSVGNSAIYTCSRTLVALAEQGFLPKVVSYIDRSGRPLVGIAISSFFGLVAFVAQSDKEGDVFNWLLAISGLSSFFTWGAICLCHIRFRAALKAQNRSTDELPFVSPLGVFGSYWGLFLIVLMLAAQFYVAIFPVGDTPSATNFFSAYLSLPVVLVMYIAHKLWTKNWKIFIPLGQLDLDTGRKQLDLDLLRQEVAEERATLAARPRWFRIYTFWCA
ncbi:hypothetical protein TPHA_0B01090 [Tetrapisispora phaffii CBS 4417]|uniref:Amino acid permease/ SLC12A domain-containing protein n=1 Tax=Tetrapisispora phaffii (strain ATCC 24235 / CBS 4417 / NBRC 1672 / NRRL Y-8282 / UCD 70-5) TaxID=1071381 RepID=G8BQI4_TETPH|nr:hypothetical protein TPHA_0B01090 [Tetrapisispora phaffii CBS 4417]CCE61781.1 hypothetical protein TPHA_0B01090 [Tetrapisispora phaffii CBS 4417]